MNEKRVWAVLDQADNDFNLLEEATLFCDQCFYAEPTEPEHYLWYLVQTLESKNEEAKKHLDSDDWDLFITYTTFCNMIRPVIYTLIMLGVEPVCPGKLELIQDNN